MELIWSYSSHANRYVLHEYYILYRIKLILSRAAIPVSAIPHFNYTAGSNAGKSLFILYNNILIIYSCSTMVGYPCILGNAENKLFMGRTLHPRSYNRLPHYPPCCISRSQWYGISTLQWIFMCLQRALLLITWEMRWRAWTLLTAMTLLCCLAIWTTATSMAIKQCMCSTTCLISYQSYNQCNLGSTLQFFRVLCFCASFRDVLLRQSRQIQHLRYRYSRYVPIKVQI